MEEDVKQLPRRWEIWDIDPPMAPHIYGRRVPGFWYLGTMISPRTIRRFRWLFPAAVLCGAVLCAPGCGGGGSGGGGGGAPSGSGGSAGGARGLCSGSPTTQNLPASFGDSCGAGSNYALCAITSADQCAGGTCLWDSKQSAAYCTIGCDVSSGSCPAGYTCTVQSCSAGPSSVCVQVGTGSSTTCTTVTTDSSLTLTFATSAADGRLYAIGQRSSSELFVLSKTQSETTWNSVYQHPAYPLYAGAWGDLLTTADAVYFTTAAGKVLRITGTSVAEETFETCTGNGDCKYGGMRLFQSPAGNVRGFTYYGPVIERDAQGAWSSVIATLPAGYQPIAAFRNSGFWGLCQAAGAQTDAPYDQICFGNLGDDLHTAPLPNGEKAADWDTAALGDTPADFLIFSITGTLYHRKNDAWFKEGLPDPAGQSTGGWLARFPTGTVYAIRDANGPVFKLAGNCWQLDPGSVYSSGLPLDNGKLGYLSMNQWCETIVP